MPVVAATGNVGVRARRSLGGTVRRRFENADPADRWYVGVSAALVLFVVGYVINGRRSGDVYWHVAVVERFAEDPWSPSNPMVGTSDPDAGFSPYLLVLGLVSRATGLSGFDVIDLAGIATIVIFLMLFHRAVRVLVGDRAAPVLALVLTLVAWGAGPWRWSGYLSLNSIGFMTGYPAMVAWCALLGAVIVTDQLSRSLRWGRLLSLAGLVGFLAITHPITLVGAVPLVAGTALRASRRDRVLWIAGAGLLAMVAVVLWPHYPVFELVHGGDVYDASNRATYRSIVQRSFLAAPGIVVLLCRARRRPLDPLVMTLGIAGTVFVLGGVTERWTAGRAWPFVLFAGHLALAGWVVEALRDESRTGTFRVAVMTGLGVLVLAGFAGSLPGVVAGVPRDLLPERLAEDERLTSEMDRYDDLAPHLEAGDVVLTADMLLARAAPAFGADVVAPGYPTPYLDDVALRWEQVLRAFDDDETDRTTIIDGRRITHALVRPSTVLPGDGFTLLVATDHYWLYRVR